MLSITLILVLMTGIISYQAFENEGMKTKLLFHPQSIKKKGEIYRFITNGFIHNDWMHLIINMYVLYQLGEAIESYFDSLFGQPWGRLWYLGVYLGSIIFACIPSYLKHQDNPYYAALGASGGTSGIVFAFIVFNPWGWFIFPPLPGVFLGIGYLWYSSYMSKRGGDNIAHDAHFWGATFGLVATVSLIALLRPDMVPLFLEVFLAGPTAPNFGG